MKFLINSKYFHAKVVEAIGKESNVCSIVGRDIIFSGNGGTTEMSIEPLSKQDQAIDFMPIYWRHVIMYLKQLPEQPITVEINYDRVEIFAVAVFKIEDAE